MINEYDTAVIGAGPAGMIAAITASNNKKKVVLIDRNTQIGRKLYSTGNGRCNLMNSKYSIDKYHGSTPAFIESVIRQFDVSQTKNFFTSLGLLLKEEDNGRIFPQSNQAFSVVNLLNRQLIEKNVDIRLNTQIIAINKQIDWILTIKDTGTIRCKSLIVATGGRASHYLGSTGDGLFWAQKSGHTLTPIYPSLVPLETEEEWVKDIQGIKTDAIVKAFADNKLISTGEGDLLFTAYGLSGPAVMSISGQIAPILDKSQISLQIDLLPLYQKNYLISHMSHIANKYKSINISDILSGMINNTLAMKILHLLNINDANASKSSQKVYVKIVDQIKEMKLYAKKLRPLKEAQVTSGGICCYEIDPNKLESKIIDNLYFAGEILDVDADSGGYNLQWAWSSGFVAGSNA